MSSSQQPLAQGMSEVLELAARKGYFLTGAESLTAGLVASSLAEIPGVSRVFLGSFITYSNAFKIGALGVSRSLIENQGAVDPEVAAQMAVGAKGKAVAFSGCDPKKVLSFATTGVAGPETSDGKDVGLVYVALVGLGGSVTVEQFEFSGNRNDIRQAAAQATLDGVREQFSGLASYPYS